MSKVYCSKCVHMYEDNNHYVDGSPIYLWQYNCFSKPEIKVIETAIRRNEVRELANCKKKNKNNDCQEFENDNPFKKILVEKGI